MSKSDIGWNFYEETLITIISRISERKIELEREIENTEYDIGVLDGYIQCIDMIKNDLECRGFDATAFRIYYEKGKLK